MIDVVQNLIDALSLGSIYALVALGLGLLFGTLRLINFAHGDLITVGAYSLIVPSSDAAVRLFVGAFNWYALIPAVCGIVIVVALATEISVFRPIRQASAPTLMIASFSVSYIIQNGLLMIYSSRPKGVNLWPELDHQIMLGGLRLPLLQLITIAVTLALMVLLSLFLNRTSLGVQMRAAAEDFKMAQYLGVRGNRVIGAAFAISGCLAAAVSLMVLTQSGSLSYQMGVPLALFGFVSVVIGGMGNLVGSVVGGFVIGLVVSLLQAYLPPALRGYRDAFAFGIVIVMLIIAPSGLVPAKNRAERI
jgi:branched-chain amino acid transport system permease protein